MDKLNRLTKNDEWEIGARYRYTKGRLNRLARLHHKPMETTFLGWAENGRLKGLALLRHANGSVVTSLPGSWLARWVKTASPEVAKEVPCAS